MMSHFHVKANSLVLLKWSLSPQGLGKSEVLIRSNRFVWVVQSVTRQHTNLAQESLNKNLRLSDL